MFVPGRVDFGQVVEKQGIPAMLLESLVEQSFGFVQLLDLEQYESEQVNGALWLRVDAVELARGFKAIGDEAVVQRTIDEIREIVRLLPVRAEIEREHLCAPFFAGDFADAPVIIPNLHHGRRSGRWRRWWRRS